ncbi:MAG: hypothetical protein ACXACY_15340 [Candidatus Hodarchaeales archaeon]|jgi:hypothetical protein
MKSIIEFKNTHLNEDIWIIAAGPSMNYVDNSFFENKITIGINRVINKFKCNYLVAKDGRGFSLISELIDSETKVILSKHESGNPNQRINFFSGEYWIFDHPAKPKEKPDLSCISQESDKIVVSYSTITSAIHLAGYMGAKNIIICGHDCGTIDGESTIENYYSRITPHRGSDAAYVKWLSEIENDTVLVSHRMKQIYGCNIHSLNPFINLNLEGHSYIPSNKGKKMQRMLRIEK